MMEDFKFIGPKSTAIESLNVRNKKHEFYYKHTIGRITYTKYAKNIITEHLLTMINESDFLIHSETDEGFVIRFLNDEAMSIMNFYCADLFKGTDFYV